MIPENLRRSLINQHYKIIGNHSAVKLCGWLKRSLKDQGYCYKQKFYGIQSHRCLQMTPWLACSNCCVYCWRIIEKLDIKPEEIDEPETIIEGSIQAQRELISGFKGYEGTDLKKWKEANNPNQVAISLVGEPTMYPKISELIHEFHKRGFTTFLVTNGLFPERLENLEAPTNLYISLDAPDPETYERIDRPKLKDYWERLQKSLQYLSEKNQTSSGNDGRFLMKDAWGDVNSRELEQTEIIDKSISIIGTKGIQGLTIKNLSKEIGISEPGIYRHFESKTASLLALLSTFEGLADMLSLMMQNSKDTAIEKIDCNGEIIGYYCQLQCGVFSGAMSFVGPKGNAKYKC